MKRFAELAQQDVITFEHHQHLEQAAENFSQFRKIVQTEVSVLQKDQESASLALRQQFPSVQPGHLRFAVMYAPRAQQQSQRNVHNLRDKLHIALEVMEEQVFLFLEPMQSIHAVSGAQRGDDNAFSYAASRNFKAKYVYYGGAQHPTLLGFQGPREYLDAMQTLPEPPNISALRSQGVYLRTEFPDPAIMAALREIATQNEDEHTPEHSELLDQYERWTDQQAYARLVDRLTGQATTPSAPAPDVVLDPRLHGARATLRSIIGNFEDFPGDGQEATTMAWIARTIGRMLETDPVSLRLGKLPTPDQV